MRRMLVAGVVLGWMVLGLAQAAAGGGWWSSIQLRGGPVAVGERLTIRSEAYFPTVEEAEAEEGSAYYVYLVRGGYDRALLRTAMGTGNPARWWAADSGAQLLQLGRISWSMKWGNVGTARASVRIPEVEPGRYDLMLCDAGCTRPFASVIPATIRITDEPLAAQALRKVDRLEHQLARQGDAAQERIRAAQTVAERATTRADNVRATLNGLAQRVQALEAEQSSAVSTPRSMTWPLTGAAALVALAALAWAAQRRAARPRRALGQLG
jgi:hypothetical protein